MDYEGNNLKSLPTGIIFKVIKQPFMAKDDIEFTNRLLKVMIALMLRGPEDTTPKLRQQVKTLWELGMKPIEISDILGKSSTYVSKELVSIRKESKK